MLKIGVVSDSHGDTRALTRAAQALLTQGVTCAFHLGDYYSDGERLEALMRVNTYIVSGNCDFLHRTPVSATVEIDGVRVFATHGHVYQVKSGLTRLSFAAREAQARLVFFGHTHVPCAENDGMTVFVNPGALKDGRCAVVEIDGDRVTPRLFTLWDIK